jgi:uncharacterized protein YjbI with pentapeptide repeats
VRSAPHVLCLAYLGADDLTSVIDAMRPGGDIDARGVTFSGELLSAVVTAFSGVDGPEFGNAWFNAAQFTSPVDLAGVRFAGDAAFPGARFAGRVSFQGARFAGKADFREAQIAGDAWFTQAEFTLDADFTRARFAGAAGFPGARIAEGALFDQAVFHGDWCGPFVAGRGVTAQGAVMHAPVRLVLASAALMLRGARFESTAVLRLRYALVDLTDVVTSAPLTVVSQDTVLMYPVEPWAGEPLREEELIDTSDAVFDYREPDQRPERVSVVSVTGVDAANLVLTDVNLSRCVFSGAYHLDRIRLEGRYIFASAPRGWRYGRAIPPVWRWTARKILAEEWDWRAHTGANGSVLVRRAWHGLATLELVRDPGHRTSARRGWRRSTDSCASPWKTRRTSRVPTISTTARWTRAVTIL